VLLQEGVQPGQDVVVSPIRNPIVGMAVEGRHLDTSSIANSAVLSSDQVN